MAGTPDHRHDGEPVREREVIVTDGGRGRGPGGMIAAIVAIVAVLLVAWLLITNLGGDGEGDVNVDLPDTNVNVEGGGDGGDGGGGEGGG